MAISQSRLHSQRPRRAPIAEVSPTSRPPKQRFNFTIYDRRHLKVSVTIYQDEDGVYIAECPSIPGCVSQGLTEAEAETNIADAIGECMAVRTEQGMPLTVALHEVEITV